MELILEQTTLGKILKARKKVHQKKMEYIEKLVDLKEDIAYRVREALIRKGIEIRKAGIKSCTKICAVDSAYYTRTHIDGSVEFCLSCVSYGFDEEGKEELHEEIKEGVEQESNFEPVKIDVANCYDVEERMEMLLKLLSIVFEIEIASRRVVDGYYTIIDRSVISIISGLNQGYHQARLLRQKGRESKLVSFVLEKYGYFLKKFKFLLGDRAIFTLKRSTRGELIDAIRDEVPEVERYNDYVILLAALEDGEYLILPFTDKYIFSLPDEGDLVNSILDIIKRKGKVIYLKGLNGGIFKMEYFGDQPFPISEMNALTIQAEGNQNILTYKADEIAKKILRAIFGDSESMFRVYR